MSDGALGFDEVLATYFGPLGVPVAYGFPVGHIDDQWTLPLGVRARLDAGGPESWSGGAGSRAGLASGCH